VCDKDKVRAKIRDADAAGDYALDEDE